jgi:hypothetical protein
MAIQDLVCRTEDLLVHGKDGPDGEWSLAAIVAGLVYAALTHW